MFIRHLDTYGSLRQLFSCIGVCFSADLCAVVIPEHKTCVYAIAELNKVLLLDTVKKTSEESLAGDAVAIL